MDKQKNYWENLRFLPKRQRECIEILERLQREDPSAFIFDFDGTLYDSEKEHPDYGTHDSVRALLRKCITKGKHIGVVTARDASFKRIYINFFKEITRSNSQASVFIGGANGSNLEEIRKGVRREIYAHIFSQKQIQKILTVVKSSHLRDLDPKSVRILSDLLQQNWRGYIDPKLLKMSQEGRGQWWVEQSKVSIALPAKKNDQESMIQRLKNMFVAETYKVVWANDSFVHVVPYFPEDGKKMAVESMLDRLKLGESKVAVFGDTPLGNDRALLKFVFSFTNDPMWNHEPPPYALPHVGPSVDSVYKASYFLLS